MLLKVIAIVFFQVMLIFSIEINQKFHFCEIKDRIEQPFSWLPGKQRNDYIDKLENYKFDEFQEFPNNSSNYIYRWLNGDFFNTTCDTINKINLYRNVNNCFKDILVSFLGPNGIIDGFLTQNGVLRRKSFKVKCFLKQVTFWIKNIEFVKYKNFVEILNKPVTNETIDIVKNVIQTIETSNFNELTKKILIIFVFFCSNYNFYYRINN